MSLAALPRGLLEAVISHLAICETDKMCMVCTRTRDLARSHRAGQHARARELQPADLARLVTLVGGVDAVRRLAQHRAAGAVRQLLCYLTDDDIDNHWLDRLHTFALLLILKDEAVPLKLSIWVITNEIISANPTREEILKSMLSTAMAFPEVFDGDAQAFNRIMNSFDRLGRVCTPRHNRFNTRRLPRKRRFYLNLVMQIALERYIRCHPKVCRHVLIGKRTRWLGRQHNLVSVMCWLFFVSGS